MQKRFLSLAIVTIVALIIITPLGTQEGKAAALDSLAIFGLKHKPLGTAVLDTATGPGGRKLTVSNIGSSGNDGVEIDLGNASGWDCYFDPIDVPLGATLENNFYGNTGTGLPTELASGMRLVGLGSGQCRLEAGFTGVSSVTIDAYLGDSHVYHESGHTGGPRIDSRDQRFPWLLICVIILAVSDFHNEEGDLEWDLETTFGGTAIVQISGGPQISCDRIVMTPENVTVDYHTVERVELKGTSMPPFSITGERVRMFGLPHEALGSAMFAADGGDGGAGTTPKLIVANIGSSGQDGVSIDLPKSKGWDAVWDSVDTGGPIPDSAYVAFAAFGTVSGNPDHPIATAKCQRVGSLYEYSADFSAIGATSITAMVYSNGSLVDSVPGITSTMFATSNGCVDDDHWGNPIKSGFPGRFGGSLTMFGPESFTFAGTPSRETQVIVGDEVVMFPEDATQTVEYFSSVEITAADISEFTITSEGSSIFYICGDADGNSIVTISDAVYMINYIFAGGPSPNPLLSGDADCNFIVTISDVVYLINYIFAGGTAPCAACL